MKEYDCSFEIENKWFRYRAAAIIIEENCLLFAGNEKEEYFYSIGGAVHIGETSEEAVKREVYEETGIKYEIDRLAFIHENIFKGYGYSLQGKECHEIALYYLMKSKGIKKIDSDSYTHQGIKEQMHWIAIKDLDKYKQIYPTFLKDKIKNIPDNLEHIVTKEE